MRTGLSSPANSILKFSPLLILPFVPVIKLVERSRNTMSHNQVLGVVVGTDMATLGGKNTGDNFEGRLREIEWCGKHSK
jgi:hypothetical protein